MGQQKASPHRRRLNEPEPPNSHNAEYKTTKCRTYMRRPNEAAVVRGRLLGGGRVIRRNLLEVDPRPRAKPRT